MRVALIEDHAVVRAGLRLLLESSGHRVVAEFDRAEDAIASDERPEVYVLDLNLPGMSGLEALPHLTARARVLVLSMHEEPVYVSEAFRHGAAGFLSKRAADVALLDALAALARGERYLHPDLAARLAEYVSEPGPEVLSRRERDVIAGLARGLELKEVAAHLGISPKTAATYKARALAKLGLRRGELARWAREHGLVAEPPA
ncbi:MAG TPA: response regulator transcription factor [Oceanithermus profundus]|uniref:Response regulator transcription factor n=1 Tax=Oceanithermus profundus TaxID=187137 RepID=A0A7C4Z9G5_9DEIN|nr:response regulator transcription factor [Oceanithermus profundus]